MLTNHSARDLSAIIGGQSHAMAGATIATSAALGCSLGEACARISASRLDGADAQDALALAERLAQTRLSLLALADADGDALLAFEVAVAAGFEAEGKDQLCRMPLEMGLDASAAASGLQAFRPLVRGPQDDLEMAITLLTGAARAASLLLDSNLRIWPEPPLLNRYEPELAGLRRTIAGLNPAASVR